MNSDPKKNPDIANYLCGRIRRLHRLSKRCRLLYVLVNNLHQYWRTMCRITYEATSPPASVSESCATKVKTIIMVTNMFVCVKLRGVQFGNTT